MKIVINTCYGGFGLSYEAMVLFFEIKEWSVYPDVPPTFTKDSFTEHDIKRDDPALVQVVEQLGDDANGLYSNLAVVEIPDDVDWVIEEYDGIEHIAEVHRTWHGNTFNFDLAESV